MSSTVTEALSPTTGEPVAVVARRNRLGIWLLIVSDAAGTVALLIAYSYLWSLNVNSGWAPPKDAWATKWPFWAIVVGMVIGTAIMWWGARGVRKGHQSRLILASLLASLIMLVCWLGQIVQLTTFPFAISDGAYASATFWLALANGLHLFMVMFLVGAISNRARLGRIDQSNPTHARFVAMWMTWICVAAFLGALFATTMEASPNVNPPSFGVFYE